MASATRSVHDCGSATSVADGQRPAAGRLDEQRGVGEPVDPPRAEGDVGAGLGQALGEGDAEPARGAGDDGDLAVEPEQVRDSAVSHGAHPSVGP